MIFITSLVLHIIVNHVQNTQNHHHSILLIFVLYFSSESALTLWVQLLAIMATCFLPKQLQGGFQYRNIYLFATSFKRKSASNLSQPLANWLQTTQIYLATSGYSMSADQSLVLCDWGLTCH